MPKYGKVQIFIHGNLEKCKKSVQGNLRKVQKISTQIKILYYRDLILLNKYLITIGHFVTYRKNKTLLASKGITLLVTYYLVARILNSKLRSVIGIKFIDNNTVVHIISSKINNNMVTFYW